MKQFGIRLLKIVADRLETLAAFVEPCVANSRWIASSIAIGALPFLLTWLVQLPGQQVISALLLTLLLLPLVAGERWIAGPAFISLTFFSHCVIAVGLTRWDPASTSTLMPDAAEYWLKQHHWITTGSDPEYELSQWVPAHLQLAVGATLYTFTSLGWLTFMQGFYEVDLMNFYLGQLMRHSDQPGIAAGTGWHIWSILRGIGFVFLTFETISLAFFLVVRKPLRPFGRRLARWGLGISFLLADGIVKLLFLESVRVQLESLLRDT